MRLERRAYRDGESLAPDDFLRQEWDAWFET
jgi:hypothetical protein